MCHRLLVKQSIGRTEIDIAAELLPHPLHSIAVKVFFASSSLFNEGFKAKKEYEEIFAIIKKDCIPIILRNINKMKEQENLEDDDKKKLEEMEKNVKDFSQNIDEIEKKYEDKINNFFQNFGYFFNLIKEIQNAFSNQLY